MDTRKIKPVTFWTANGNKKADELKLYNFHNYNFDASDSAVSYKLGYTVGTPDMDGNELTEFVSLNEGSVILPYQLVETWGSDDEPIWQYVLTELKLTEV